MAVNNSLQTTNGKKRLGISAYLSQDAVKNKINSVIGGKDRQRFISAIVSATTTNPELMECTNSSILSAALVGESLKLSPSPQLGQYYLVPYSNKNHGKVAQFQLGYKGYIQLALRSGYYRKLNVVAIKEGELIHFDPLDEKFEVRLIADEEEREAAETTGYYAMFEYMNGFRKVMYWSKAKMLAHADKYSQAFSKDGGTIKTKYGEKKKVSYADFVAGNYDPKDAWMYSSFWYKDFDGMAYKTMLRQLISKWGIMSIELQTAIDADMAVINEDGTKDYVETEEMEYSEAEVIEEEPAETVQNEVSVKEAQPVPDDVQQALFG